MAKLKKSCMLILIPLLLAVCISLTNIATTVYAADKSRWVPILEDQQTTIYLDRYTHATYKQNGKIYLKCWVKVDMHNAYCIAHYTYRMDDLLYMIKEFDMYDSEGKHISSIDRSNEGWKTPTPDSNQETMLNAITIWIGEHFDSNPPKIEYP